MSTSTTKLIEQQNQWGMVAIELSAEDFKLMSYDKTLLEELDDVAGKKVLDYGSGPGVLALALKRLGADVKAFDINQEMVKKTSEKIGAENVYGSLAEIPSDRFDIIICNLVLCIVSEEEAARIVSNIKNLLAPGGKAYIGFCNPKICNVPESQLDFRFFSEHSYSENHSYRKIKKEGVYEIIENHRPVDWYGQLFFKTGLVLLDIILTPEYKIRNDKINDFVIFKLQK